MNAGPHSHHADRAVCDREERLAEILEEYLTDLEGGMPRGAEELADQHPEFADELKSYIDSLRFLHEQTTRRRTGSQSGSAPGSAASGESIAGREVAPIGVDGDASNHLSSQRVLGDYRLGRELGRGGMGIVYEAHQISLNRRVAVKVLPFAAVLDDRQIARFRNEAQAAAQLHHPNIVPVFAVGQQNGVHYFAMQCVDGQSLAEVIGELRQRQTPVISGGGETRAIGADKTRTARPASDRTGRGSTDRGREDFRSVAQLVHRVALALHHAHDVGIVHRDIKPSNLLVDSRGEPWVTDFGLARVQSEVNVTGTGDVVGTLRYMSPEQAAGRNGRIDPRTDVYSLGATLYELLTLCEAFPGEDRQSLLRRIANEEPTAPRRIDTTIPRDLETIVLKAMEKDRDDRYATAQDFADDLHRFLSGQPPRARRATSLDRAGKWVRRHRSIAATLAVSLFCVAALSLAAAVMLAAERDKTIAALADVQRHALQAETNSHRANTHFRQAREAVQALGVDVADRLAKIAGTESIRREVLSITLDYNQSFVNQAKDEPALRADLVLAHYRCGQAAARLGDTDRAIEEYRATLRLGASELADPAAVRQLDTWVAVAHNNLALLLADRGEIKPAEEHYLEAIERSRLLAGAAPTPEAHNRLVESQGNLAMLLDRAGESHRAYRVLDEAAGELEELLIQCPDDARFTRNLAIINNNISYVLRDTDLAAAEQASLRAIEILHRVAGQLSPDWDTVADLALFESNLATIHSRLGNLPAAIDAYHRAIERQTTLRRMAPQVVRHRSGLAIGFNNLGVAYCRNGQQVLADEAFASARREFGELVDDFGEQLQFQSGLAGLLNNQGLALASAGRTREAVALFDEALEMQTEVVEQLPHAIDLQVQLKKIDDNRRAIGQSLPAAGDLSLREASRREEFAHVARQQKTKHAPSSLNASGIPGP